MAKTLEEYRAQAAAAAAKEQDAYASRRKQQAQQEYAAQAAIIDAEAAASEAKYREKFKETDSAYREQYDENAVKELITQRQVEETMANLGLARSGTARVGQTAATAARQKADEAVSRSRQAAVEELNRLIAEVQTEAQADKAQAKAKTDSSLYRDVESYRQKQASEAEKQARYNYETAVKNAVSEKRAEYAMLLIRQKYGVTEAWEEAYRRYPAEKEETV